MNNRKLKAFVLSMGLGAAMLTAPSVQAQGVFGDLLDNYYDEQEASRGGLLSGGLRSGGSTLGNESFGAAGSTVGNEAFGANGSIIHNEPFGAPIGGGLGILLAAGAGYALIQSKKNKQN